LGAIKIIRVTSLPLDFQSLLNESKAEGINFLEKMSQEWISGANRFSLPNESLFAAFSEQGKLAALGGLNVDPYLEDNSIGRVRHLYVSPIMRGQGIGKSLVERIIQESMIHFKRLRLRTSNLNAVSLYQFFGFKLVEHQDKDHYYMEKDLS
jgi:ribosomal protein S18 acetylase RimI-like enzyme